MLETSITLPPKLKELAERFFKVTTLGDAAKLLRLNRAVISFKKGDMDGFLIYSGIVRDNRSHECKLVYKKRLEDTPDGPLSSNCDCHLWTDKHHCPHVATLFLHYLISNHMGEHTDLSAQSASLGDTRPPIAMGQALGVNVDEYGTILPGPHALQGAGGNSTYSGLQYLLHNKSIVNFPIPAPFKGKLILELTSIHKLAQGGDDLATAPRLRFIYANEEGTRIKPISLFENLYLFNWLTGEALHVPTEMKEFIQKLRHRGSNIDIDEVIKLALSEKLEDKIEVVVDETPLASIKRIQPHTRVDLAPGKKKGQIDFKIYFHTDEGAILPPPEFLTCFTFEGGILTSFRRKKDAYDFINALVTDFRDQTDVAKRYLSSSAKRQQWIDLIAYTTQNKISPVYDSSNTVLVEYDNKFLIDFFCALREHFTDALFRYSVHLQEDREIHLMSTASTLFNGLSEFYTKMTPFGVVVWYDRKEIGPWSSRIRFERKQATTNWFDLELQIHNDDWNVIKGADLDQGLALTNQGLIMLTKEQKDLLRFMQKYTKYEASLKDPSEEDGEVAKDMKRFVLPFNRARIFELFELKKIGVEGALTAQEEDLCRRLSTLEEVPDYTLPAKMENVLRPYQKVGFNWLSFLFENRLGACLADDMGLGKTLQAITFIQSIIDQVDRILIVCPVSILLNWENEFKKFSDIDIHIYHGGDRALDKSKKVILTSYGVMKKEADEVFENLHFDILVLDEVQHLKNIRSIGAYAARKLKADFRICLTGTPVENDLAEFYNILDLSIPGVWGDLQFVRTTSNSKSRLLARKTASPFILRRTKAQVLTDLPDKIENTVALSFSEEEQAHYEKTLLSIKTRIQGSPSNKKYGEILRGLLALRQSCLWQTDAQVPNSRNVRSTKIEFLMETLEQILEEGHQAIIFSQFTTYLDIIQGQIHERHWKFSRIDGSQQIKKRQKQVDDFQEGRTQVFLISLKAGGVGLNLTAASYVFVMDPWWNPAVEQQAIDRAHRIGQKNVLTVYRPVIQKSVEEKVLKLQEMKRELFQELLPEDEDDLFTGKLTMKDFEHLFN